MDGAANSIAHSRGATLDGHHDAKVSRAPRQSWTVSPHPVAEAHFKRQHALDNSFASRLPSQQTSKGNLAMLLFTMFFCFQSLCLSTSQYGGDSPVGVPCQIQNGHTIGQIIGQVPPSQWPISATAWMVANRDLERPKMTSTTIEVTITSKALKCPIGGLYLTLTLVSQERRSGREEGGKNGRTERWRAEIMVFVGRDNK